MVSACTTSATHFDLDIRAIRSAALGHYGGIRLQTKIERLYARYKERCVEHLDGEFALILWDANRSRWFAAVDRFGQRDIFYTKLRGSIRIAPSIEALVKLEGLTLKPNLSYIAALSSGGYYMHCFPEQTVFENVYRLPAAHYLMADDSGITVTRYWQPRIESRLNFKTDDDYIEQFQALMRTAVASKIDAGVPVASLLSGGLDSSSIVASVADLQSRCGQGDLLTLAAVLPEGLRQQWPDESRFVQQLSGVGKKHINVLDEWRGPFDNLHRSDITRLKPFMSSRYYLYQAFATAADAYGAQSILDGSYGEAGPSFNAQGYFTGLMRRLRWIRLLTESRKYTTQHQRSWLRFLVGEARPLLPNKLYGKFRSGVDVVSQSSLLRTDFIDKYGLDADESVVAFKKEFFDQPADMLQQQLFSQSLCSARAGAIRADSGKAVRIRYPYLNKALMAFCLALPEHFKCRDGYRRYAIRLGMQGLLPDEIRWRTCKQPFSPDYHLRYNRQLPMAREFLASIEKTPLMCAAVDIPKLEKALEIPMQTARCSTVVDYRAMHSVPQAMYLLAFLRQFG